MKPTRSRPGPVIVWLLLSLACPSLAAAVADVTLFDFGTDYEGWLLQFAERQDDQTGLPLVLNYASFSPEGWDDATRYPFAPGTDGIGNGQGAFVQGLRLEGVLDGANPEHCWLDAVYVQSEDVYTHMQSGWPAGYEQHSDYAGVWPYGHHASLGTVTGDYLSLRVYNPGFTHANDAVQAWFYTRSGVAGTWFDGGPVNLEHGWNMLRLPVSALADPSDLRDVGVKVGAHHPVWGEMYVDGVRLGATAMDGQRYMYVTPDAAWFSEQSGYESRSLRIYYDDGGQISPGVRGFHLVLRFPPECVTISGITPGNLLAGFENHFEWMVDNTLGEAVIDWVILGATSGVTGFGSLAALTVAAADGHAGDDCCGVLDLDAVASKLRDPDNLPLTGVFVDGKASHDITPPVAPVLTCTTHTEGGYSAQSDFRLAWAATADQGTCPAGMRGYYLLLDQDPGGEPDPAASEYTWFTPSSPDSSGHVHWFEGVADGTWYVHIIGYDWVWNATSVDTFGPIKLDTAAPPNVTGLDADVTDEANLSVDLVWTNPGTDFAGVKIFRKGFGNYPEYDDPPNAGQAPPWPVSPSDALANGWVEVYDGTGTSFVDHPAIRDYYYYAAFTYDLAANFAAGAPGAQDASLSYWLGDFATGSPMVNILDVLVLSLAYNSVEGDPPYNNICDIGPTSDYGRKSLPTTDNEIEFEDLMVLALNYEHAMLCAPPEAELCAGRIGTEVVLTADGAEIEARVLLRKNPGCLLGASIELSFGSGLTLLDVVAGDLWPSGMSFFHSEPRTGKVIVDAAALGTAVSGDGCHAVVRFRASDTARNGAAQVAVTITNARIRGSGNVDLGGGWSGALHEGQAIRVEAVDPGGHGLMGARPNPTALETWVHYRLAFDARVSLQLFDAAGRLVRVLADELQPAGDHRVAWDGRRVDGRPADPGVYFYRLQVGEFSSTCKLMVVR